MNEEKEECAICLSNLSEDKVEELSCKHCFHRKCIIQWSSSLTGVGRNISTMCPFCRKKSEIILTEEEMGKRKIKIDAPKITITTVGEPNFLVGALSSKVNNSKIERRYGVQYKKK